MKTRIATLCMFALALLTSAQWCGAGRPDMAFVFFVAAWIPMNCMTHKGRSESMIASAFIFPIYFVCIEAFLIHGIRAGTSTGWLVAFRFAATFHLVNVIGKLEIDDAMAAIQHEKTNENR